MTDKPNKVLQGYSPDYYAAVERFGKQVDDAVERQSARAEYDAAVNVLLEMADDPWNLGMDAMREQVVKIRELRGKLGLP